jgi:DHA2 family methylenomycin A resistance protein-like MFS transporter
MDVSGQLLALAGLAGIAGALNEAGAAGWGSVRVMVPVVTGVVALVAFVRHERRLEHRRSADRDGVVPLLPPSLLRNPGLAAATVIGALLNIGFYGLLFLIPAYFQRQLHYSPLTTGLAMLPAVGMALFASPLSGRITARHGSFGPTTVFLLMGALGSLGWLLATPTSPYTTAFLPLAASGLAAPLTVTAVTTAALESVPAEKTGVASAMLTTSRQMGSALGVALFGTLAATSPTLLSGLHVSAVLASLAFLTGSLLAFAAARGKWDAPHAHRV